MLVAGLLLGGAAPAAAFDQRAEDRNYSKTRERYEHESGKPEYRAMLRDQSAENALELAHIRATDPERKPDNLCAHRMGACAGDVRLYDWGDRGYGLVRDVLYTARSGATISGRVWATVAGPEKRPGVVITTGSIQAPETLYWYMATVLAKMGYVVLTYDVQGQGRSDVPGEAPDEEEGVPAQQGQPFYDGTEDGLDFLLSSPSAPYQPRPSCSTGTSHEAKQARRVAEGRNTPHNPLWELVDAERIGIIGHSLGASAVSFVGQRDPRVDAIVAWDNLRAPSPTPPACLSAPDSRVPPAITKPALGMSADYGLTPTPYRSDPDPETRNQAYAEYRNAGVDAAQLNIRGGTHYEWSYLPSQEFGATLRGIDMATWYTAAWLDKYVKGDQTADRRLLTGRWRDDARGREIDPNDPKDGNLFSFYLRSRISIGLSGGGRAECDDLRSGCDALVASDGWPGEFSYLAVANSPDRLRGSGSRRTRTRRIEVPRRISLRRRRRILAVRLVLPDDTRVTIKVLRRRRVVARRTKRLQAGRDRLRVRFPRGTRPGRYTVEVTLDGPGGPTVKRTRLVVTR
jgi:dienelactone hydrolase